MKHDKLYPPSSFPMREKCVHFTSDPNGTSEAAEIGTLQHRYIEILLTHNILDKKIDEDEFNEIVEKLSEDSLKTADTGYDMIVSKYEEIKLTDPDAKLLTEKEVTIMSTDFTTTTGTVDVAILGKELHIMDYKSGQIRSYAGQLKTYALGAMQLHDYDKCVHHIIYGAQDQITTSAVTLEEAQEYFDGMINAIDNKDKEERHPNDYCSWCSHSGGCPARLGALEKVSGDSELLTLKGDVKEADDATLENTLDLIEVIKKFEKEVSKEVEKRIAGGTKFSRYEMKAAAPRRSVGDLVNLSSEGFDLKEIAELSSMTVTNLMKLIYGDDARKKASKEDFEKSYSHLVVAKESKPTLKKRK